MEIVWLPNPSLRGTGSGEGGTGSREVAERMGQGRGW